jgi:hypothetical protein
MMMDMYLTMNSNSEEENMELINKLKRIFIQNMALMKKLKRRLILGQIGSNNDIQVDEKLLLNINTTKIEELGPNFSLVLYKNMFMIFSQCFFKDNQ